jgi:hypothetical protein
MVVTLPPEVEKKLIALAAQKNIDPASLVASLVEKELNKRELALAAVIDAGQDDDVDLNALNRAMVAIINRTPEQIKAAQNMALKEFRAERELPEDAKTIFDVIPVIRGNETDEQVIESLKESDRISSEARAMKALRERLDEPAKVIPELRDLFSDAEPIR